MHTIHGSTLVPVQSLVHLITTQCSINKLVRQCSVAFRAQAPFAQQDAWYVGEAANGSVRLDVDPPMRPRVWLCPERGRDADAADCAGIVRRPEAMNRVQYSVLYV